MKKLLLAVLFFAPMSAFAQDQGTAMAARTGKFVARGLIVSASKDRITQLPGTGAIATVNISVSIENDSEDNWSRLPFDIDIFDSSGNRLGSTLWGHSARIWVSLGKGETKDVVSTSALTVPEGTKKLAIARYEISLPKDAADSSIVQSGGSVGFLAKDQGCGNDLLKIYSLSGVEQGKAADDLVKYCGGVFESPAHAVISEQDGSLTKITLVESKLAGSTGWVPTSWVTQAQPSH